MAPGKYLTIDETLYPMRNHIGFKTYMANKPASYGINFKSINEAGFPYTYSMVVQAGKPENERGGPYYTKGINPTVERLVSNLKRFQKIDGRNITTDNLYTSPELAEKLLQQNITTIGTLRSSRQGLPNDIKSLEGRPELDYKIRWEKEHVK